jgi:hypothetical protein
MLYDIIWLLIAAIDVIRIDDILHGNDHVLGEEVRTRIRGLLLLLLFYCVSSPTTDDDIYDM